MKKEKVKIFSLEIIRFSNRIRSTPFPNPPKRIKHKNMKNKFLFSLIFGLSSFALFHINNAGEIDDISDSIKDAVGSRTRDGKLCKLCHVLRSFKLVHIYIRALWFPKKLWKSWFFKIIWYPWMILKIWQHLLLNWGSARDSKSWIQVLKLPWNCPYNFLLLVTWGEVKGISGHLPRLCGAKPMQ